MLSSRCVLLGIAVARRGRAGQLGAHGQRLQGARMHAHAQGRRQGLGGGTGAAVPRAPHPPPRACLLYTSDAADE